MNKIKINFFILKFGAIFHTIFVFPILYYADISAKTPMFWVFLLNHIMFAYFVFIRGCALGIKQTINIIAHQDAAKAREEDINKNN
jgi:hypothetical protein